MEKITAAKVVVCCPGRNFVTLKIETASGAHGLGDEAPGLGVEIDEAPAAEYPYERAYLPVNRLEDGTMHSW